MRLLVSVIEGKRQRAPMLGLHAILLCVTVIGGCAKHTDEAANEPSRSPTIEDIRLRIESGRREEAVQMAKGMLVQSPQDPELLRIVANAAAMEGRYREAAELALAIAQGDEVADPVAELLQAFDWHLRGGDYASAEEDLRLALRIAPADPRPHRTLAQLLNSQGRRHEASTHVLELAQLGAASPRELLSLVDRGGPFQLVDFGEIVDLDANSPGLFALGKARHQLVADNAPADALATLDRMTPELKAMPVVQAFRARLLSEPSVADADELERWLQQVPSDVHRYSEFWLALGRWLQSNQQVAEAARAFGEALRRDPTDRHSLRSLAAALSQLGEDEKANTVQRSLAALDQIFRRASSATPQQSLWIGEQLQNFGRHWESLGWFRHALQQQGQLASGVGELNRRAEKIHQWQSEASPSQLQQARLDALLGFDIRSFPLPDLNSLDPGSLQRPAPDPNHMAINSTHQPAFEEIAKRVGIDTQFISEYPIDEVDFFLHQANGGGIAALDYDLDGRSDLYIAQSGGDPNVLHDSVPNQLYRQLNEPSDDAEPDATSASFRDVATLSESDDRKFAQGVCAADINQDGFVDLLLANIGPNVLLINQGDGTYRDQSHLLGEVSPEWTSSFAAGDLDGDQLPEIVEVNYVDDPLIFEKKCVGKRLDCTPQRFSAAVDRIYRNTGDGSFALWDGAQNIDQRPNYGFGVVLANFDERYGNDLFISNDGDLNHFWRSHPAAESEQGFRLVEDASVSGLSVGASGIAQACMGIASGDLDRNGKLDLAITNFYNEPVNLFLQNDSGFFQDDAHRMGLAEPTNGVLGFGTQAADFENDGWLDLAILNGHIYDARYADIPFQMPPQLFRGGPSGFTQVSFDDGGYFTQPQLGRTLALLDWNRDGRMDLAANHLDLPIALLENQSTAGNWVQFQLTGIESERSAVGAKLTVHAGDQQWTVWNLGGDGYMATNTPVLHVGVGDQQRIDRVTIRWPSGETQTLDAIAVNQRYLVVEHQQPWIDSE